MPQPGSFEEREAQIDAKLEELYATINQRYPAGPMADEARDYYEQAQRFKGEEKMYYVRLLASMLQEF